MIEARHANLGGAGRPNLDPETGSHVIGLSEDRLAEAGAVLARSFRGNPNFVEDGVPFTPGGPPNWTMHRKPEQRRKDAR